MQHFVQSYLEFGTQGRPPEAHRRIMATNVVLAMTILTGGTHGIFCALYDFDGLWPQIATYGVGVTVSFAAYPILKVNPIAAALWYAVLMSGVMVLLAYLTGRNAGLHLYMLAGSSITLSIFGVERWRICAVLPAAMLVLVLVAQVMFQAPAPFMRFGPELEIGFLIVSIIGTALFAFVPTFDAMYRAARAETLLAKEHERSEELLDNLLPPAISARLKDAPDRVIADDIAGMSILFADIVDFTPRAANRPAVDVVALLNEIFSTFDDLSAARGLEKIKTIGDAYMAVGGAPEPREGHEAMIADLALAMNDAAAEISARLGEDVQIRFGAHTGAAVAGVIGSKKVFYDVWGDAVNTAARLESHGAPGRIQISAEMKAALGDAFFYERRGVIDIKGKGPTETWWLLGRA